MKIDQNALKHLHKEKTLSKVIASLEAPKPAIPNGVYHDLTKAIIYQQISVKAADSIYNRYLELIDFEIDNVERPAEIPFDDLRSVGLSRQKANYIQNISIFFSEEKIKEDGWDSMSDEEIIKYLTQIKGVGEWTVQMILIFTLLRPDVLPVKDYAIQVAMKRIYKLESEKAALIKDMYRIAEPWQPHRSLASRYLWQWLRENR